MCNAKQGKTVGQRTLDKDLETCVSLPPATWRKVKEIQKDLAEKLLAQGYLVAGVTVTVTVSARKTTRSMLTSSKTFYDMT